MSHEEQTGALLQEIRRAGDAAGELRAALLRLSVMLSGAAFFLLAVPGRGSPARQWPVRIEQAVCGDATVGRDGTLYIPTYLIEAWT